MNVNSSSSVIIMNTSHPLKDSSRLDFNTNIRTYSVMENNTRDGYVDVVPFKLEEKGHKIVGFRGKSTEYSPQQIGVYVKPIDDAN
ncbi:hypothetical protein Bca52824_088561 [Brassica carinata]|uniref:Jacalin-type lectin domain-containing protein n=1 Tax=Brassica carinata TaxID=52824 RepID=A0A8X7PE92_BRACI|nr:hypothetical protein Bca52824_088561 [Brassica carinata]